RFLPHLSLSELETGCFSTVLPKVVKVFASLLEEISKQIGGLSSQNTELHVFLRNILKMMVQTLESLSGCVHYVCSCEESVSFDAIRSLPSCILSILKDTFQHCKSEISPVADAFDDIITNIIIIRLVLLLGMFILTG
uniref:Uncharacterized protein n=1 Tax=Sinocyclocheilus rhinocerous TaxID=307959 RepID=A0A673I9Y6_9TELE